MNAVMAVSVLIMLAFVQYARAVSPNPHGDLVYKATRATMCSDCHGAPKRQDLPPPVLNTEPVRELIAKGKGNHGPGRFADCFRCHAGGRLPGEPSP